MLTTKNLLFLGHFLIIAETRRFSRTGRNSLFILYTYFSARQRHFSEKFISFYKNNLGYLNDIKKEAEGKNQYVQWKESDKDVKPIQIAIRKKEKIKKLLETMRTTNQIRFTKRILGIEPTTEEGKELKEKLKFLFKGYK